MRRALSVLAAAWASLRLPACDGLVAGEDGAFLDLFRSGANGTLPAEHPCAHLAGRLDAARL